VVEAAVAVEAAVGILLVVVVAELVGRFWCPIFHEYATTIGVVPRHKSSVGGTTRGRRPFR